MHHKNFSSFNSEQEDEEEEEEDKNKIIFWAKNGIPLSIPLKRNVLSKNLA